MSLVLNIDTATGIAHVGLAENGIELMTISNTDQKDHAAFLHNAVKDILEERSIELKSVDAIAVSNGPGSYTGLRVGMASAKGFCYALNKPFITIGSLDIMANAAISDHNDSTFLYCPMIDARRMEVFTALFDGEMNSILPPSALILTENSFIEILENSRICFFGSGAVKWESLAGHKNAFFVPVHGFMKSMAKLSFEKFSGDIFTDLVDSEPLYVKNFHNSSEPHNKK